MTNLQDKYNPFEKPSKYSRWWFSYKTWLIRLFKSSKPSISEMSRQQYNLIKK